MRIWVTRAEPEASQTAQRLRALGHAPLVAPVLAVQALDAAIDLQGVATLAFTSANGVRAFAARCAERSLPVYAVGDATAAAARAAGFAAVASAAGDVEALARLILRAPPQGAVLAPGAAERAGDLIGLLQAQGAPAQALALYETRPTGALAPPGAEALLLHSPKAADEAAKALDGDPAAGALTAYCLSPAVAAPLQRIPLRSVSIAGAPSEASLLALLPSADPGPT
jgi:uroporphyrinogen-III synthase